MSSDAKIDVHGLSMGYGDTTVMSDVTFRVCSGDVFAIMGGSGCGKSTLLRHLIGLHTPRAGAIYYDGKRFDDQEPRARAASMRSFGVLYQSGALWSSMTLAENVALPLQEYSRLTPTEVDELARLKLGLVGLDGFGDFRPDEVSGGMRKRAGLARAIALDPEILFFDEPSAGLDPFTSRQLDDLILELRESLGATVVIVTHELASIFAVANDGIFLDAETRMPLAQGNPAQLRDHSPEARVRAFLRREHPEENP